MTPDLVFHLARFAGELRASGVRVALADEEDAVRGLVRIDIGDRREVREALRCTLKIRPVDSAAFEALFASLWEDGSVSSRRPAPPAREYGPGNPPARQLPSLSGFGEGEAHLEPGGSEEPGYSRDALLRRKPFEQCDDRDLARMERLLLRLAERLATRRCRRLVPSVRGRADLRRSMRRAFSTGGELMSLARREHPVETPRLVLLCDTSGSMDGHARFLLSFVRALKRVAKRTEVFAFNTELVRITSWVSSGQQARVLARLSEAVPDWSGGTRIGECLDSFAVHHLSTLLDARTVVVIFSDGLDWGEPELLARSMRRIHDRAGRVIWLNPLLSDPRYAPTARGMAAALPFVDRLAPAHDLDSLERLLPHLAN